MIYFDISENGEIAETGYFEYLLIPLFLLNPQIPHLWGMGEKF